MTLANKLCIDNEKQYIININDDQILGFDENTDIYGTMDIFSNNNPDVFFDSAIQEALIGSCAFAHVSHGDNGELMPKLSLLTAMDATGEV